MACYVDPLASWGGSGFFKGKLSCHLWADTEEELHKMAGAIGLRYEWFQDDPRLPHYDLVETRRRKAVRLGAIECTLKDLAAVMKARRESLSAVAGDLQRRSEIQTR